MTAADFIAAGHSDSRASKKAVTVDSVATLFFILDFSGHLNL